MAVILDEISKAFGEKTVLSKFSARFDLGQSYCIMGTSGCGKTTLLHIIMGIIIPDSGRVSGTENHKLSPVFQEHRLCENLSVGANIRMVCSKTDSAKIAETLEAIGLAGNIHTPVSELSGGMKRRVAIARAICSEGEILIMDEPFKGLDNATKEKVMAYTREKSHGKTVIWVTHDEREAEIWGGAIFNLPVNI